MVQRRNFLIFVLIASFYFPVFTANKIALYTFFKSSLFEKNNESFSVLYFLNLAEKNINVRILPVKSDKAMPDIPNKSTKKYAEIKIKIADMKLT